MGLIKGLLFWGYLDDEGQIFVKRYTSDREIANYERLPFTRGIFDPFEAFDINQAREMIKERYMMEKRKEN